MSGVGNGTTSSQVVVITFGTHFCVTYKAVQAKPKSSFSCNHVMQSGNCYRKEESIYIEPFAQ